MAASLRASPQRNGDSKLQSYDAKLSGTVLEMPAGPLGLALGAVQLYYSLGISAEDIAGLQLPYEFPYQIALLLLPIILAAAFISAVGPAESAVRGSLVEALEYE